MYRSRGPGSVPGAPPAGPPADPAAGDAQEEQRFPAACSDGPCGSRYFASTAQPRTERNYSKFFVDTPCINLVFLYYYESLLGMHLFIEKYCCCLVSSGV